MKHDTAIMLFRRDLRLEDNTALNYATLHAKDVIPVFVFDNRQLENNPYKSENAVEFMCESLEDLHNSLETLGGGLWTALGVQEECLEDLIKKTGATLLVYNKDYTPFALKRDEHINKIALKHRVETLSFDDATLHAPGTLMNADGKPYIVYTYYRLAAEKVPVPEPKKLGKGVNFLPPKEGYNSLNKIIKEVSPTRNEMRRARGGRQEALKRLHSLKKNDTYSTDRDFPALPKTSFLSAHIKFGTLSVREVYHYAKSDMPNSETFLRELFWHDFFTSIGALHPHVYDGAFRPEFNKIEWSEDKKMFEKWKDGKTGFPIVDAGMRELNQTGYMHNRVRMIVASFLIKDLHINWQWGEKYFAQKLTDYDPAVNNGNWQWVAGTGCDASPWFRIFNPYLQQKKFDQDCEYIKLWLPELKDLSSEEIHDEVGEAREKAGYPKPICDHRTEAEKTKMLFAIIKK